MTRENEAIWIQRLVDGELDRSRIRQLLHQAEAEPGLYRRIALSMIEDQIWRRAICVGESGSAGLDSAAVPAVNVAPERTTTGDRAGTRRSLGKWLAIAAALMVTMWLGYETGRRGDRPEGGGMELVGGPAAATVAGGAPAAAGPRDVEPDRADPAGTASRPGGIEHLAPWRMRLVSNDGQPLGGDSVPVVPYSLAREMGVQYRVQPVPADIQKEAERLGYRAEPVIHYLHGRTNDGRRLVYPVQQVRLTPRGL